MDELDQKLDRSARRLEARRSEFRQQLQAAPELASLLEGWKAAFGPLRVSYVQVGTYTDGDPERIYEIDGRPGVVIRNPAPYSRPQKARRGAAEARRERERLGR